MKYEYICNKCGYRWRSDGARYCLNCHSDRVERRSSSRKLLQTLKKSFSTEKRKYRSRSTKGREKAKDLLVDVWHSAATFIFVVVVFIALLLLMFLLSQRGFV